MSLDAWKVQFYPKAPRKRMTKREAIEHSLRKYEGVIRKNLETHCLTLVQGVLTDIDGNTMYFGTSNCALCVKYMVRASAIAHTGSCKMCPLYKMVGVSCSGFNSPYRAFTAGDSRPMRTALRKLLKMEISRRG